jgi:3-oxoacyl-[acyl-carrier protein] reductase
VNITSSAVKSPIDILGLSNGARSGLTGFVAGVARSKPRGPGRDHQQPAARRLRHRPPARHDGRRGAEVGAADWTPCGARKKTIPAQRFGTPEEFGAICAFLCSMQAGYMTGQNVLADGGAYPGTY